MDLAFAPEEQAFALEVRTWLGGIVAASGLDAKKLDTPSPYDMPFHALAYGARYSLEELTAPLATLSAWYANANAMLGHAQHKVAARIVARDVGAELSHAVLEVVGLHEDLADGRVAHVREAR